MFLTANTVDTLASLAALTTAQRKDGLQINVLENDTVYIFHASATDGGISPSSGTGKWLTKEFTADLNIPNGSITNIQISNDAGISQSKINGLQSVLSDKANVIHNHTASNISDFAESVDDRLSSFLVAGSNISLTYNDTSNNLTISASTGGSSESGNPVWDKFTSYWGLEETRNDASAFVRYDLVNPANDRALFTAGTPITTISRYVNQKLLTGVELTSGNHLYASDNTLLKLETDFSILIGLTFFGSPPSTNVYPSLIGKTGDTNRSYEIYYNGDEQKFGLAVTPDGTTTNMITAFAGSPIDTAIPYFIHAYKDSSTNKIGISINNGTAIEENYTGTTFDSTNPLRIGAFSESAGRWGTNRYFAGIVKGQVLTPSEVSYIYNSGKWLKFPV